MRVEDWLGKDNKLGQDIWSKKYQYKNESFDQWVDRISGGNEIYKNLILEKKFLPAGRILSNRGLEKFGEKITLSNCYVLKPPQDSIESIFDTAKEMARTFSYGGGVGIDISKLSPAGAKVNNAARQTSGAVSFMDLYSQTTASIGQNGRRGALMISLNCNHPDVEQFIDIKSDLTRVTKANISVKVTEDFIEAVNNDTNYTLSFTREETGETIEKIVRAKELFKKLCYMNWDYAEPGILFWDRIKSWNLLSNNPEFEYAGVNPCAEETLPAGGSCLLGSINLAEFVKYDEVIKEYIFDEPEFRKSVRNCVTFLNEILDEGLPLHPLQIQRDSVRDWRQIGLGIMGLADCLIKLGLTYGSQESIQFSNKIGGIMIDMALQQSALLAKEYGPYPKYTQDVMETEFFKANASVKTKRLVAEYGLRNSQLLTCAPTGSLSTMLGISGGIEPIFANYYMRKTQSLHGHDEWYKVYTPIVDSYMRENNLNDDSQLPEYFITSSQIKTENRILMQATWQKHIDASISSTVNLPTEATVEDVENLYLKAAECGLKGITVYRSGCKREGVLVVEQNKPASIETLDLDDNRLPWGTVVAVNSDLIGIKTKVTNGCGTFHLQLFFDEKTGRSWETFIGLGDGGGCERNLEFISKLISKCLRAGVPIEQVIETAKSIRPCISYCNRAKTKGDTSKGTSCPSAIGYTLEAFKDKIKTITSQEIKEEPIKEESKKEIKTTKQPQKDSLSICPECGGTLVHDGGCCVCQNCGWSKCS